MLKKLLNANLQHDNLEFEIFRGFIGNNAFAYLVKPKKMAICADGQIDFTTKEYLTLENDEIDITKNKGALSFPIFEWRERYADY